MIDPSVIVAGGGYALPAYNGSERRPGKRSRHRLLWRIKEKNSREKAEIPNKCGHLAFGIAENNIPRSHHVLSFIGPLGKKNKVTYVYPETYNLSRFH